MYRKLNVFYLINKIYEVHTLPGQKKFPSDSDFDTYGQFEKWEKLN